MLMASSCLSKDLRPIWELRQGGIPYSTLCRRAAFVNVVVFLNPYDCQCRVLAETTMARAPLEFDFGKAYESKIPKVRKEIYSSLAAN